LICFIGTLRALNVTADSIRHNLIEELNADVLVCVSKTSSHLDEAAINNLPQERIIDCLMYEDAALGYDYLCDKVSEEKLSQPPPYPWRKAITIAGNWLGGFPGRPGSGMHLNYNLYRLSEQLKKSSVASQNYTHFIITRTDFQWLAPHPPLELLDDRFIWIPEGEDYHGYNDRHAVCSKKNISKYLDFFSSLISGEAFSYLKPYKSLNHEYQLKLHLTHRGVRVGRFKNYAYLTATANDLTNCAAVTTKSIDGIAYHCKYPGEVDSATANSKQLKTYNDPRLMITSPSRMRSRVPLWKARIRSFASKF
jgi:hypothetical protein